MSLAVLVTGGRDQNPRRVAAALHALNLSPALVMHGAARGADAGADLWAREAGVEVERHPADWTAHGGAAGPIRNGLMLVRLLRWPGERMVIAFPGGRGTADMVRRAQHAARNGRLELMEVE